MIARKTSIETTKMECLRLFVAALVIACVCGELPQICVHKTTDGTCNVTSNAWNKFRCEKHTYFVVPGYFQGSDQALYDKLVVELMKDKNNNVYLIDWKDNHIGVTDRDTADSTVKYVGNCLADFALNNVFFMSECLESCVKMVCHSEGCHVAGQAARTLKGQSYMIDTITAISPSGAGLYSIQNQLQYTDARSVPQLHVNDLSYATEDSLGSCQFYANGGQSQPACYSSSVSACSHNIGIDYLIDSMRKRKDEEEFYAYPCYASSGNTKIYTDGYLPLKFGLNIPANCSGQYCFSTNNMPPFGKGDFGKKP